MLWTRLVIRRLLNQRATPSMLGLCGRASSFSPDTPSPSTIDQSERLKQISEYFEQYVEEYTEEEVSEMEEEEREKPPKKERVKLNATAVLVSRVLAENRAKDVLCAALDEGPFSLNFVCSAQNKRHARALADILKKEFINYERPGGLIGMKRAAGWYVMDMHEIVVHVMEENVREKFDLDSLWATDDWKTSVDGEEVDEDFIPPPQQPLSS